MLALAARMFEANLQQPIGAKARGYLSDRGLGPAVQQRFSLGYASPDRFHLRDALAAKGVGADQMIEAGSSFMERTSPSPMTGSATESMFPIHDRSGRVIAFGGRAMEPGAKAKYLNSPETALFHKGALLFNHHRARKTAHDSGEIIVVEGYIDAIAVSEAGFPNVVAPLGTALTADQCALLWGIASEPILCFDGDSAGRRAAFRAIETALPLIGASKSLRFALLPEGQDPDDLIRLSGPAAMADHLKGALPFADMLFLRETDGERFDTPEQRASLERRLPRRSGRSPTNPCAVTTRRTSSGALRRFLATTASAPVAAMAVHGAPLALGAAGLFPRAAPAPVSLKRPCSPRANSGAGRAFPRAKP